MRTIVAAILIALVAVPAYAQGKKHHKGSDQSTAARKPKVDDKAYNKALSSLPDKKYDPWNGIRQ